MTDTREPTEPGQPEGTLPPGGRSIAWWLAVTAALLLVAGAVVDAARPDPHAPHRAATALRPFQALEHGDIGAPVGTSTTAAITDRPVAAGDDVAGAVDTVDIVPARAGDVIVSVPVPPDDASRRLLNAGSIVTMLLTPLPDAGDVTGTVVADVLVLRVAGDSVVVSVQPDGVSAIAHVGLDRVTFAVPAAI